ncbi:MAG: Single-stranded DNA-binding protein [Candidatus Omnitrophica bacterium]|nr:Single-stranded DNA-binding protein [Candidatus Omnitrophota bacterium]
MASLNKVLLMGNLTRDPELKYIPNGSAVTSFTVAMNRSYKLQTGEKKEETAFVRVVVWGRQAETCNDYLKKGRAVFVEGRLQSRSWETPDGQKRSTLEVIAQTVQFLGGRDSASSERSSAPSDDMGEAHLEEAPPPDMAAKEDETPF